MLGLRSLEVLAGSPLPAFVRHLAACPGRSERLAPSCQRPGWQAAIVRGRGDWRHLSLI